MDEGRLAFRTARLIALAFPAGVVLFWVIAWFLTKAGGRGLSPGLLRGDVAIWIWAVVALAGFLGAFVFRGRALQAANGTAEGRPPAPGGAARVLTTLIVAWALLEGQALLGGVLFLLLAVNGILLGAACVYAMGLVLTFPRAEWFGVNDAGD